MGDYLDLFDLAAHEIQEALRGNSGDHRALQLITGEHMWKCLSVSFFLLKKLKVLFQEKPVPPLCGTTRPGVISTELTRRQKLLSSLKISSTPSSLRPGSSSCSEIQSRGGLNAWSLLAVPAVYLPALLLVSVPRLYSDYLYFKVANKSAEDFHLKVLESVHLFQSCLTLSSLRSCVYNTSLSNAMPVTFYSFRQNYRA